MVFLRPPGRLDTYPRRIRRRSKVGHIFREKKCVLWAGKYGKRSASKGLNERGVHLFLPSALLYRNAKARRRPANYTCQTVT